MEHVVVVLVGLPVTMALVALALGRLNPAYAELTQSVPTRRGPLPWHRSLRAERGQRQPSTVLDVVVVWSVTLALLAFVAWFLLFAEGGGLPG